MTNSANKWFKDAGKTLKTPSKWVAKQVGTVYKDVKDYQNNIVNTVGNVANKTVGSAEKILTNPNFMIIGVGALALFIMMKTR